MALINCSECGSEVSDKAVACPKCGNPINPPLPQTSIQSKAPAVAARRQKLSPGKKVVIAAAIIFIFVAVASFRSRQPSADDSLSTAGQATSGDSGSGSNSSTASEAGPAAPSTAQADSPAAPEAPASIKISASQLYAEYHANEVSADSKYKGKRLIVSGVINEIGKDFTGAPYVTLIGSASSPFDLVRAKFGKSSVDRLAELQKSQSISVTCEGAGMVVGQPVLDCSGAGAASDASSDAPPTEAAAPASSSYGVYDGKACGRDDLVCRGEAGIVGASVYCKDPIERQAKYSVKWTDGTFEMKMSRYRFTDASHETLTYVGDKAEFQNGFGAYTPVTYQCTIDNDNKTVENVVITEGRLPD